MLLNQIYLTQFRDIFIGKTDSVSQKRVRSAVNAVDLVESGLQEVFSCGEQKIERMCRADIEYDGDAEKDQRVDEAAGAVGAHIIAHDDLAVNAERHENDGGGNARA